MSKTLILMRHAEAQPQVISHSDRERILTLKGWQELEAIKRSLQRKLISIDTVLCSNATRTRQTFESIRTLLPITAEIIYDDRLYQASALQIIKQISCVKDERKGIIVIGHNPGLSDFLNLITKREISASYFSSSAVAFFKTDTLWSQLRAQDLTLYDFLTPQL